MILYSFRKWIKREFYNYFFLIRILVYSALVKSKSKKVYIDISEIELNRYLYNFIKFFTIEGYTVYIPCNRRLLGKLSFDKGEFKYASWILKENIKLGKPKAAVNVSYVKKEQLSNDFFNDVYFDEGKIYHVPMSMYPLIYKEHYSFLKNEIVSVRKNAGIMAGNFDKEKYEEISKRLFFKIPNRIEIATHIRSKYYYKKLSGYRQFENFLSSDDDKVILLIDTKIDFSMLLPDLLEKLENFNFFIALPGIHIPQSHNLIEALGCGCIPIIHKTYANLLEPPLVHQQTAIIYEDYENLDELVKGCFQMDGKQIVQLRTNVIDYYNSFLSPAAVVASIVHHNYNKIFIQAENVSLDLLKDKNISQS